MYASFKKNVGVNKQIDRYIRFLFDRSIGRWNHYYI